MTAPPVLSPLLTMTKENYHALKVLSGHRLVAGVLLQDTLAELDAQRATVARLTADYDKVLTAWAESRERHALFAAKRQAMRAVLEPLFDAQRATVARLEDKLAEIRNEWESSLSREMSTFAELKERRAEVARLMSAAQQVLDEWDAKETNEFASIDVLRAVLEGLADKQ